MTSKIDYLSTEPNLSRIPPIKLLESLEDPQQYSSYLISSKVGSANNNLEHNKILSATYCRPLKGNIRTIRKFHLSRLGLDKNYGYHDRIIEKLSDNYQDTRNYIYSSLGHNVLSSSVICSWPAISALVTRQNNSKLSHSLYVNNEICDVIYPFLNLSEASSDLHYAKLMGISALRNAK